MGKKKQNPARGLSKKLLPNLAFNQQVTVITGKYAGKDGKVFHASPEGNNTRLQIKVAEEPDIYVDSDEINVKFETMDLKLFLPEEEHNAWDQRIKELEEYYHGNPDYSN